MRRRSWPFVKTLRNFLPIKEYFLQNRWPLALGLICLLAVDFLQLIIPLIVKQAIDLLTLKTATNHTLFILGMTILGIALMIAFFRYLWRLLILGHSRKVEEGLRNRLYSHVQTLPLAFFQRTKTGDLMAMAINDTNAIRMAAGMGLVALADGLVLSVAAIGFMLSINIKLTLISLIPAPIVIVFSRVLTRRMSAGFERVQNTFSDLTERVREAFSGVRVVKAYHREPWERQKLKEKGERYISVNMGLARTLALFFPVMAIFTNAGLAIVVWFGGRLTILGDITTGDFVAFTSYLNLLTWPMMAMGWVTNLIQRASASMGRINRVLEQAPEIRDSLQFRPEMEISGTIQIKGLFIRHPGQKDAALKDIRLHIQAGETVALVGRVGSGKTTLLHVIPRLLDVSPGTVFLGDLDILEIPLKRLRRNIGFVTQEPFIFSDTIGANILLGRKDTPQGRLETVLRAAHIWQDVETLEKGWDTLLGERGITLSGGQRQRLTIARALLVDHPILILDDALSMVDTRTEEKILNRILELRHGKTNIIVSHRVSTISRADRIIVLDKGAIVEEGPHENLLERGGVYAALYEKQLIAQELERSAGAARLSEID
ncbi:MAG: ABC transporter ATP-binding protein [Deltaproteobacteria bacterium]|nr:ABC transporter ATP-binding protein [Deltaproteobacteria bacterium]